MGLDPQAFERAFGAADTEGHIKDSRALLAKVGGQGFPTLALEHNGQFTLIDIGPWLGTPGICAVAESVAAGAGFIRFSSLWPRWLQ
jgi:protein-disulfide isomerase-like protein with CxxC motif